MVTLVNVPRYIALLKNYGSKPMLTHWLANDGEAVEDDQPLAVVETTKTSLEIRAMVSGVLVILRQVGEKVDIGDTLGMIADSKVELAEFRWRLMAYPMDHQPEQSAGTTL